MKHTDFVYPTRGLVSSAHIARGVKDASQVYRVPKQIHRGPQAPFAHTARGVKDASQVCRVQDRSHVFDIIFP